MQQNQPETNPQNLVTIPYSTQSVTVNQDIYVTPTAKTTEQWQFSLTSPGSSEASPTSNSADLAVYFECPADGTGTFDYQLQTCTLTFLLASISGAEAPEWRFSGNGVEYVNIPGNCEYEINSSVVNDKTLVITINNVRRTPAVPSTTPENKNRILVVEHPGESVIQQVNMRLFATSGSGRDTIGVFSQDPSVGIIRGNPPVNANEI